MSKRRVARLLIAVMVSVIMLIGAVSVSADIGGRTTIRCIQNGRDASCESPQQRFRDGNVVAGSTVEASFVEVFIDGMQLLYRISELIKNIVAENYLGALVEMYGAYNEALQLDDAAGDKQALEQAYVRLDQNGSYDRVTLTFNVWSDDDVFQDLKVAAPIVKYKLEPTDTAGTAHTSSGGLIAAVSVGPIQGGRGQKSGQVVITLSPKKMPLGRYPIVLSIKENNCSIPCLTIVHVIHVSVYKTCRLTPNSSCDILSKRWNSLQAELFDQKTNLYPLFSEFRRQGRARIRYCGFESPGRPQPIGCDGRYDNDRINQGYCSQFAAGLSESACRDADPIFQRIRAIEGQLEQISKQIIEQKCCHEAVNPAGGTGVPGRDLNVTTHESKPHSDKPEKHNEQPRKPTHEDLKVTTPDGKPHSNLTPEGKPRSTKPEDHKNKPEKPKAEEKHKPDEGKPK